MFDEEENENQEDENKEEINKNDEQFDNEEEKEGGDDEEEESDQNESKTPKNVWETLCLTPLFFFFFFNKFLPNTKFSPSLCLISLLLFLHDYQQVFPLQQFISPLLLHLHFYVPLLFLL